MSRTWTNEQQRAIDEEDKNILVSAAAGSGKTAVLVERIIKKITRDKDPIDIDKLLVMTFTKAAAQEMKERISSAIKSKLDEQPDNYRLQKQLIILNRAEITTMHSFCNKLIKRYFQNIDIDPSFRIADENEATLLKMEAVSELIEERYDEENIRENFRMLVEGYSKDKSDSEIDTYILELHSKAMAMSFPEKELKKLCENLNLNEENINESFFLKLARKEIIDIVKSDIDLYDIIIEKAENYGYPQKSIDLLNVEKQTLVDVILRGNRFIDLKDIIGDISFKTLTSSKDSQESEKKEITNMRNSIKANIKKINERYFYFDSFDELIEETKYIQDVSIALVDLVIDFDKIYKEKKLKRGLVDYNDLEHLALDILIKEVTEDEIIIPSDVALELRENYNEVLIDEYQDTNEVQETLIKMIAKEDGFNTFMVGDVKQSIYRFRNTNPSFFLNKYYSYSEDKNDDEIKILLYKNFRSRSQVLSGTNYIFKRIMSEEIGDVDYTDKEALNCGATFLGEDDPTELIILDAGNSVTEGDEEDGEEAEKGGVALEGSYIAKRIHNMVNGDNPVLIDDPNSIDGKRKLKYRDIVILLRATKVSGLVIKDELENEGIPVFLDSNKGGFDSFEINIMMSLLQIIDNPCNDIPLLGVLRSPIFGFDEEELISIRDSKAKGGFYYCLVKTASGEDSLSRKCANFLEKLKEYREKSIRIDLVDFIWYLFLDTKFYTFVATLTNGLARQENLKLLLQKAREFEKTSFKGLYNFINFINKVKVSNGDFGSAITIGENEDVVRIMSIHKSKGLEFPVVILPNLSKKINLMDLRGQLIFHSKLGFGLKYSNGDKRVAYETLGRNVIKGKIEIETKSEEMRVLYVALTRAKEKLILVSSVKDLRKDVNRLGDGFRYNDYRLPKQLVKKCNSYLDWILLSLIMHRDAKELRELKDGDLNFPSPIEDDSRWKIDIISAFSSDEKEPIFNDPGLFLEELEKMEKSDNFNKINDIFTYKYKYESLTNIVPNITVSEIKKRMLNEEERNKFIDISTPRFLREDVKLSGAEVGTAHHTVLENIDLDCRDVKGFISSLVIKGLLSQKEESVVKIDNIQKFLESDLAKRMRSNLDSLKREFPIQMRVPTQEVYNIESDQTIILNGIVDAFFIEDGKIVIVDYKSDYYKDKEEMREKYKHQLMLYKRAIELITEKKVKECVLYLLHKGEELVFN